MSIIRKPPVSLEAVEERLELFDHLNLPYADDKPVDNTYQPLQAALLSSCLTPHCDRLYPGGAYYIGADSGIYWKLTRPRLAGCKAPDWYLVPEVPRMLDGQLRRSYVLWQEHRVPAVVMEFVSGDGLEERDETAGVGKYWVYERGIRAEHYVIWDPFQRRIEAYRLMKGRYRALPVTAAGRVAIASLQVELGIWPGVYQGNEFVWLRAWDGSGAMLPSAEEIAEAEKQRAEAEKQRAEAQTQRAESEKHRAEVQTQRAESEKQRAEAQMQRAESEKQRAESEKQRAESEKQRAEKFAAKLRELGIQPDQL